MSSQKRIIKKKQVGLLNSLFPPPPTIAWLFGLHAEIKQQYTPFLTTYVNVWLTKHVPGEV